VPTSKGGRRTRGPPSFVLVRNRTAGGPRGLSGLPEEGNKVVVLRGPREGSVIVFRVDAFEKLLEKAGALSEPDASEPTPPE
jgi:hypothetical protein